MGGTCSACTVQDSDLTEMRLDPKKASKELRKQLDGQREPGPKPSEGKKESAAEGPSTPLLARTADEGKAKDGKDRQVEEGKGSKSERSLKELTHARATPLPELPENQLAVETEQQAAGAMSSRRKEAAADKVVASLIGDVADRALDIALGVPAEAPVAKQQEAPKASQMPLATIAPTSWRHLPSVGTWLLRPSTFCPTTRKDTAEPLPAPAIAPEPLPVMASFVAVPVAQDLVIEGSFVALPLAQAAPPSPVKLGAKSFCEAVKLASPLALPKMSSEEPCNAAPPSPVEAIPMPPSPVKAIPTPASSAKAWHLRPSVGTWLRAAPVAVAPPKHIALDSAPVAVAPPKHIEEVTVGEVWKLDDFDVAAFGEALAQCAVDISGSDLDVASIDNEEQELPGQIPEEGDEIDKLKAGVADLGTAGEDDAIDKLKERMASVDEAPVVSQV